MRSPSAAFEALRRLGPRPLAYYAWYQLKLRAGWIRWRTPPSVWSGQLPIDVARPEAFPIAIDQGVQDKLASLPAACREQAVRVAEGVLAGEFELFGRQTVSLGYPPAWGSFAPLGDGPVPSPLGSGAHWTAYPLDRMGGDVKLVWEASRFAWVYALGRGFVWTGDVRFAAGFTSLLDSWLRANPPNMGPQWISGQEVAIRLMALIFAWRALDPWLQGRDAPKAALLEAIAVHAGRIPPTLDYARSQDNNHLLVEAAALYVAGVCFPGLAGAERWRRLGRDQLVKAARRQFFADGGYVQHSMNYARLAIETLVWASVAAQRCQEPFPETARDALARGSDWLEEMALGAAGRAPNFGPNDGGYLLPLTACDYEDHRPTVDAARRLLGRPPLPSGPWSELGHWLGLPGQARAEEGLSPRQPADRPQAGQYFLGGGRLRAVLRAARFLGRPGHADQLHVDIWFDGHPLTLDPGTYLYSGADPWDNALAGEEVHNLPMLDGRPAMTRAGRFLWLDWAQARLVGRWGKPQAELEMIQASHDGYRRLGVSIQRTVLRLGEAAMCVVDEAVGPGEHALAAGWNLPAGDWTIETGGLVSGGERGRCRIEFPDAAGAPEVYQAGQQRQGQPENEHPTWGWFSPTYAQRQPCLRVVVARQGRLPLRLVTWFIFDTSARERLDLGWSSPGKDRPPWTIAAWGAESLKP